MKKIKTVTFRFDRNDFPTMADKFKELLKGGVE